MNMSINPKKPWFTFLKEWIPDRLPGEAVHTEMAPMRQVSSEALKEAKMVKESAVAIHLFEENNDLNIILTQRNVYEGAHSGQVSFPGGKKEEFDQDHIQTARRESFEEINLEVSKGTLIGSLTEIYIPVSSFKVAPIVFYHEQEPNELKPDPREVHSIFYLPGKYLLNDKLVQQKDIRISEQMILRNVPCFQYEQYTIWGATAILLNELKHILRENY